MMHMATFYPCISDKGFHFSTPGHEYEPFGQLNTRLMEMTFVLSQFISN